MSARTSTRPGCRAPVVGAVLALLAVAAPGRLAAQTPDPAFREAQLELRMAQRDTTGRPLTAAALDSLGVALAKLDRTAEARVAFERALALEPGDRGARAGLARLLLIQGEDARAESLLASLGDDPELASDLYVARLRLERWREAAALADAAGQAGRAPLLESLAESEGYVRTGAPQARLALVRVHPVPLVRVRLEGEAVLMAVDPSTADLLVDDSAARRLGIAPAGGQSATAWAGGRVAVRHARVGRLELGGMRFERVPAGIVSLRRYSLEVNPQGERLGGVIGSGLLRRLGVALDLERHVLELSAEGTPATGAGAARIPFQVHGEGEVVVHGSFGGSRRLALIVATGMPGVAGAPPEVLAELGIRPGAMSRAVRGMGTVLQGSPWSAVQLPGVTVGPLAVDRAEGWSGALEAGERWRHGARRDGLLGAAFFRNRRVVFDWSARELRVEE